MLALPSAGALIHALERRRRGAAGAVVLPRSGCCWPRSAPARSGRCRSAAVGLFAYGIGTGVWDVAMNVEGAEVERGLGRSIMPRFHAAWSSARSPAPAIGVPMAALRVPMPVHLGVLGRARAWCWSLRGTRAFLPRPSRTRGRGAAGAAAPGWSRGRWRSA